MKIKKTTNHLCGRFLATVALTLTVAITARADYQSTVLADHPLAFYPINSSVDPAGQTATDLSGNGNNGVYNGTDPEFNTVSGPSSFIPTALFFDGFTSFVDLSMGANSNLLNFSGPITMEAWVQPASPTVGSGPPADILGKGFDGTFEITLRAQGGNYYGGYYTNGITHAASGGIQTTNWTYLVSTYDGTNWNLYVNGALVQAQPDSQGAFDFPTPWAIGDGTSQTANRFFQGNITEVAIYTNALTPAQLLNHFYLGELGTSPSNSVPIIITQPQPQTAVFGGTAIFSVGAVSAFSTTNQWFKNNVAMTGKTNATLTLTNVGAGDAVNYSVVVGNINGTTNSISASLTVIAANSLKWNSSGTSGVWDTGSTADWLNVSNSTQTVFNTFDQVLFDDTVGVSNNVIINGTVSPSLITVNSSANNFTFSQGSSPLISGTGSLIKQGSSTLTIVAPANFTGPVSIQGGTIYAGDFSFTHVASVTITNNSTLDFGGSTPYTFPVVVSGTGVGGQGALYNSFNNNNTPEGFNITLAGDATFGGSQRWDLIQGSISGPHKVTVNWSNSSGYGEWDTVTIATNVGDIEIAQGSLAFKGMGDRMGDPIKTVIVDPGTSLTIWGSSVGPNSGYNKNIHVLTNAILAVRPQNPNTFFNANVTLEGGAQWDYFNGGGTGQTNNGTYTLNGIVHMLIGDSAVTFTNVISGAGGFVWDAYNNEVFLGASNTYSGPTVIGGGLTLGLINAGSISQSSLVWLGGATIDVNGRPDRTLTLAGGQTLGGIGTISGSLVVNSGATISPAGTNVTLGMVEGSSATGTISVTNAVTLNGTTVLKLDGSGVNDEIQAGAGITYGGTLSLVNISGAPYAVGNLFQVFSAASYSGSFASISPSTPGAGMAWSLTNGFLSVVSASSQPVVNNIRVLNGNLIFSGSGGTANGMYSVLTTTNLTTSLTNWTSLATNSFDGVGAFSVTNAISPTTPQRFFLIKELP